jgi:hypothetical protein
MIHLLSAKTFSVTVKMHQFDVIRYRAFLFLRAENRVARWFVFTKNPDLGKFWSALEWKILVYFMTIWNVFGHFL